MILTHLTASTFFGGPERQMLGLAEHLPPDWRSVYLSFSEGGRCEAFLDEANRRGHETRRLEHDTPHLIAAIRELIGVLPRLGTSLLFCHGYKADLLGRVAARKLNIPVVAVSRGWTGENLKVRIYEWVDRLHLGRLDHVVCVSEAQAQKVLGSGVSRQRVSVIRNAIDGRRFARPDPLARAKLLDLLPHPCALLVGAIGRLSPEKGFGLLIEAAREFLAVRSDAAVIHFGDGPLRAELQDRIEECGLSRRFILAGQRQGLDTLIGSFDAVVLPSFSEGLPNVVLEAQAAGVPVVATAVGGTPEVLREGEGGFLVPPGDTPRLARRVVELLGSSQRRAMGQAGRQRVLSEFTFTAQAREYQRLITSLCRQKPASPSRARAA